METLTVYVVKSKDGKYFRSKGYSGYGESWVDDIKKAKVYLKIGPARSQVTFWSGAYPEYGVPDIIELTVTGTRVLDEGLRVSKALKKKKLNELQHSLYQIQEKYDKAVRENNRHKSEYSKRRLADVTQTMTYVEQEIETLKNS